MITKHKAEKGASWFDVGLGAVLAVVLGVALGAAYLVIKPVTKVAEIPKDAPAGALYYIEGVRDFNKAEAVAEKRKELVAGESVAVSEGEFNSFLEGFNKPAAPAPAKPGEKAAPAPSPKAIDVGNLNVRIHGGKIQFADMVTFNALGASFPVLVQTSGVFSKHGSTFAYDPETFYVGGCPMQRLLFFRNWAMKRLLFTQPVPDDISEAWSKLADVTIEGSTLRLKMP